MPTSLGHGSGDEDIPLTELRRPGSPTSATSSDDFERLLSDDVSDTSSSDLPPVDGGRGAWMCLLGCWIAEAMIWGLALAFGIFQSYYSSNELFKDSSSIPTIGTLATGVAYLGIPFVNVLCIRWARYRKAMCVTGWLLCLLGLLGASFATRAWQLLLFQGLLFGSGWVMCYTPFLFMFNEWWVERRGLAYGIMFGASGVSGLVIPLALEWMLERFGFRVALRAYVLVSIVISGPALLLIKPRLKSVDTTAHAEGTEGWTGLLKFAGNIHFIAFALAVFLQGLAFFIPNIFIASFAEALGLSSGASSGLLALLSLSQVAGQFFQGWISDRVNVYIPLSFAAAASGLGALLLWGPAKGMAFLVPFALIWGFESSSYSVLYTRVCSFLTADQDKDGRATMLLYGFFSFERGVAAILEGPISSWLLDGEGRVVNVNIYGLGMYASVVWFTTVCMFASSACGLAWFWARARGRWK